MNKSGSIGLILVALAPLTAQDLQVNVRTSGAQANPALTVNAEGDALIVWSSHYTTAGRSNDISARWVSVYGVFLSDELRVNVNGEGNQTEPAVALSPSGTYAVVWQGPGPDAEDIFMRMFDPGGTARTDDLPVNLNTAGHQRYPRVARSGDGTVVVVWESKVAMTDGDRTYACAQLFDPNGSLLGTEIIVDDPLYDGRYPDVAMDGSGRFAVAWLRETGPDTIVTRLFDANGVPITAPLAVSTARISSVTQPSIAMNSHGYFAITWDGDPNRAADDDIHARRYDPNGVPRGEPFMVNTVRAGAQQRPQVAMNDANELLVVWQHDTQDANRATDIFARRFDPNGQAVGDQFRVNAYTQKEQRYPDVALADSGAVSIAWDSNGQDGSGYGIFAQMQLPPAVPDPNRQSGGAVWIINE